MKYFVVFIIFLCFFSNLEAQILQNIRGSVIDQDSKEPLIGANATIKDSDPVMGAATDVNGNFKISEVPIGKITILVSYTGYSPKTLPNLELTSAKELILNIELVESINMKEVVVTSEKNKGDAQNEMTSVSARTFSIDETMRYAGSLNDVARMAQNFAGVQGANDSRNDIVIRGNSPTGVLFRLEDIDIPNPNHFALSGTTGGPISILNNNVLDNSDFLTGAFPAEYGNALAGVFDIKLRAGNNQKHEFLGQIGFNGLEFMSEGPINRDKFSSYLVNYRYSTLKVFQLMGINFGTGTSVPDYQDASFKLNFPNKKGKFTFWGVGGISSVKFLDSDNDEATLFSEKGEDLVFNSNIGVIGLSNVYRFQNNSFIKTSLSVDATYNNITSDTLDSSQGVYNPFYRNTTIEGKQSLNITYQNKINARHLIKTGIYNQRRFYSLKDSVNVSPSRFINPLSNDTIQIPGYWLTRTNTNGATYFIQPFFQWQWKLNEKLTANTGVHAQYFFLNKTYALEPRVGISYNLFKKTRVNAAFGVHNQLPPGRLFFRQLADEVGNTILDENGEPYIPNRELEMTTSYHYVLGIDQNLGKHTRIKTEVYYQDIRNAPVQPFDSYYSVLNYGANFDLIFPDTLVNAGIGRNYGVEITLERFLNKGFYYLLTTSLYQSEYQGSDKIWRNTAFNGNYTANFLIGKEFELKTSKNGSKNNLVLDLNNTYNGGQRYIPIDIAASKVANKAVYGYENAFEPQQEDYFRIDLKVSFKRNGKKVTQEFGVNFQNLTNRKNIFQQLYDPSTQELVKRYQNGFLPIAQYKIYF